MPSAQPCDEDDDDIVDDDEPEELLQQFRDGTEMKIVILGTNEISLTQNRLNIKENPVFLLSLRLHYIPKNPKVL